jgi:hypothetical protein
MQIHHKDFGLIFWIHMFLNVIAYTSPFWLNWKFILVGVFLYYCQELIFRGCLLTRLEFKGAEYSFWGYYLSKIGIYLSHKQVKYIIVYAMPIIIFLLALIWQVVLEHNILLG